MDAGRPADFWYAMRLEHIHTLPQPWDVGEDFKRVEVWLSLRLDDVLEFGGIDVIVQRGWYGSVDFRSPDIFARHVLPNLRNDLRRVHDAGAKFGYVMTTGVKPMRGYRVEAGVDLWYWAGPVQRGVDLRTARDTLRGRVAIAGGVNAPLTFVGRGPRRQE